MYNTIHVIILHKKICKSWSFKTKNYEINIYRKTTFNINKTTIHFTFAIPLNKGINELKSFLVEKKDSLIKKCHQFCLLIIDKISLIRNQMLTFIDQRLLVIKQVHNQFMGSLDIILTIDFYQTFPIKYSWIFKPKLDGFNFLSTNCWHQHAKCYELHQVMWQNDIGFIHVFNRFWIATQTTEDISNINNICLKPTPLNSVLPYLFYTNTPKKMHNIKKKIDITLGQTFKFLTQNILFDTFPTHFKLSQLRNETSGLHTKLLLKENILIELCASNYSTLDGLVNGANGTFQVI